MTPASSIAKRFLCFILFASLSFGFRLFALVIYMLKKGKYIFICQGNAVITNPTYGWESKSGAKFR